MYREPAPEEPPAPKPPLLVRLRAWWDSWHVCQAHCYPWGLHSYKCLRCGRWFSE